MIPAKSYVTSTLRVFTPLFKSQYKVRYGVTEYGTLKSQMGFSNG